MYNAKPLTLKHQGLFGRWVNFRGRHNTWPEVNYRREATLQPLAPTPTPALTPAVVFGEELFRDNDQPTLKLLEAGIAHDFNNLLTVILGNLELAQLYQTQTDQSQLWQSLDQIQKAAQQAKALSGHLSTLFQGNMTLIKQATPVEELVKAASQLGLAGTGGKVECSLRLAPQLPLLKVDKTQISQVIMNLVLNATQAMPKGGRLEVEARVVELAEGQLDNLIAGQYVQISVQDTGMGMAAEQLSKIFAPHFTTKEKGKGLGLALSYIIIKRHRGHITVESEVGVGTIFRLFLPVGLAEDGK